MKPKLFQARLFCGAALGIGPTLGLAAATFSDANWTTLGSGMGGPSPSVYALAVSGSDLYVGSGFKTAGGIAATNIAKWNGSSWTNLGSGTNGFENGPVGVVGGAGNGGGAGGEGARGGG